MDRNTLIRNNDLKTKALIDAGRLKIDAERGLMFAVESKTPSKPVGTPNARGYLRTCITTKGKAHSVMVHRAIWIAAHGVPPDGWQINHRDGVKTNNALSNLELVTPAANNEHARDTGLWRPVSGLANGFAKLSDAQVAEARRLKKMGTRTADIAAMMGVSEGYMRRVVAGSARS